MRVRRSHRDQKTHTCTGHAAGLFWSIHSGLSDLGVLLKCPRSSESPNMRPPAPKNGSGRIKTLPWSLWCEFGGPTRTKRRPRARDMRLAYFWVFSFDCLIVARC